MAGEKYVTVESQVIIIRRIAYCEIGVAVIILLSQTVAIAASHDFASRSLTGIWTSWFFFMAAGIALFWSSRCTFNGLLTVLILQIISATMAIPLFTACCVLFGVYPFRWHLDEEGRGRALVGSSITILVTNIFMMFTSIAEMCLNGLNAYNCYFLAYVGKPKEDNNYDQRSMRSVTSNNERISKPTTATTTRNLHESRIGGDINGEIDHSPTSSNGNGKMTYDDIHMPQPPPDLTLVPTDILIIKYCGVTGVLLAVLVFCTQTAMLALASESGIKIGIGIWGALYYSAVGVVTVYCGWKPSSQSTVAIFVLQIVQFVISIPLTGIAYYIVAVFGSCMQEKPVHECPETIGAGLAITILGAIMAISGTVQGLISLILILICSQAVCGIRCMVSGATVYPTL